MTFVDLLLFPFDLRSAVILQNGVCIHCNTNLNLIVTGWVLIFRIPFDYYFPFLTSMVHTFFIQQQHCWFVTKNNHVGYQQQLINFQLITFSY